MTASIEEAGSNREREPGSKGGEFTEVPKREAWKWDSKGGGKTCGGGEGKPGEIDRVNTLPETLRRERKVYERLRFGSKPSCMNIKRASLRLSQVIAFESSLLRTSSLKTNANATVYLVQ